MEMNEIINAESTTIVDVRSPSEYSGGHAEGSINIPLDQVKDRLDEFKNMSTPLVLCCASGGRSGMAMDYLTSEGLTDLYNGGGWHQVQIHKM